MITIHTIGHSNHPIEKLVSLLQWHRITTLVDVRSHPTSQRAPHFKMESLRQSLADAGIEYVFLGRELGGRPEGAEFYDSDGRLDTERRAEAADFVKGVDRLVRLAREGATAVLCAEEDPERCHRRHLIAPVLRREGFAVLHIRGDGKALSDDELSGPEGQLPLFR